MVVYIVVFFQAKSKLFDNKAAVLLWSTLDEQLRMVHSANCMCVLH